MGLDRLLELLKGAVGVGGLQRIDPGQVVFDGLLRHALARVGPYHAGGGTARPRPLTPLAQLDDHPEDGWAAPRDRADGDLSQGGLEPFGLEGLDTAPLALLENPDWHRDATVAEQLRPLLMSLAAAYYLRAKTKNGQPLDPVARFHLGNGARLEQINWLGDVSPKGLRESAGVMVNYLYRLDDIEKNHEAYANDDEVVASNAVKKLLKGEGRRLLDLRLS